MSTLSWWSTRFIWIQDRWCSQSQVSMDIAMRSAKTNQNAERVFVTITRDIKQTLRDCCHYHRDSSRLSTHESAIPFD
ncbi:hypothetical protein BS78_01G155000 [Paspalum vaginatum]|nr:hypothetical protein BS78_01G155000 [Paspalum vaginatum]